MNDSKRIWNLHRYIFAPAILGERELRWSGGAWLKLCTQRDYDLRSATELSFAAAKLRGHPERKEPDVPVVQVKTKLRPQRTATTSTIRQSMNCIHGPPECTPPYATSNFTNASSIRGLQLSNQVLAMETPYDLSTLTPRASRSSSVLSRTRRGGRLTMESIVAEPTSGPEMVD
jgi:hypothetical protein